jgi:A/G-specific adenine glycosylase
LVAAYVIPSESEGSDLAGDLKRKQIPRADGPRNDSGRVRRELLRWFRREKRSLPWRDTRDPYRIWVSEVMLQQTTVAAVCGRYERFLERFPDVASLARAREQSVLAAWSGLGYYARARNLRRAAQILEREYQGRLPKDPAELRRLPGFGPYMAAAVASLAYGVRAPAAEANVTRVLSRLFAIPGLAGSRRHSEHVIAAAAKLLPRQRPGDLTAALMDLGQTICTPRRPRCTLCPLRDLCAGRRGGKPERYPRRRPKARFVRVAGAAAVVRHGSGTLLVQRDGTLLSGLWQFPYAEGPSPRAARRNLAALAHRLGLRLHSSPAGDARHTIMNRRMEIRVFRANLEGRSADGAPEVLASRWFHPRELVKAAIPTLTRKIARAAGFF